jgi:TonB family protein
MKTLLVKQSRPDGVTKIWKVKPSQSPCTFGTARIAGLGSIDSNLTSFEGVFQLTEEGWTYVDTNPQHIEGNQTRPLEPGTQIDFEHSRLEFQILEKDHDPLRSLENFTSRPLGPEGAQLFLVTHKNRLVRSEILSPRQKFNLRELSPAVEIESKSSADWIRQDFEDYRVHQKSVSLEDVGALQKIKSDDFFDNETKKPLATAFLLALILGVALILTPKKPTPLVANLPQEPQKMLVKIEQLKNRRQAERKAAVIEQKEQEKAGGGQGRVGGLLKSFSAGRISHLVGKISAGAAVSKTLVIQSGPQAGTSVSGRALAALGKEKGSDRDWGAEGAVAGHGISTLGKAGGRDLRGLGGLAAGKTGKGGVGLIEDESEVSGGLDRDIIAEYIKKQVGHILACYERQLSARKDLGGKVSVKFTIGGQGTVEAQNILESTMGDASVEGCILNRVAKWIFPAPTGGTKVIVTYPFLFKSTN